GELAGFLFHSNFHSLGLRKFLLRRKLSDVLSYSHGTEMRTAHAAKVCGLGAFLRQGFVVELARGFGIEREIELIFPAEFEACFANCVVAVLRAGMAFR